MWSYHHCVWSVCLGVGYLSKVTVWPLSYVWCVLLSQVIEREPRLNCNINNKGWPTVRLCAFHACTGRVSFIQRSNQVTSLIYWESRLSRTVLSSWKLHCTLTRWYTYSHYSDKGHQSLKRLSFASNQGSLPIRADDNLWWKAGFSYTLPDWCVQMGQSGLAFVRPHISKRTEEMWSLSTYILCLRELPSPCLSKWKWLTDAAMVTNLQVKDWMHMSHISIGITLLHGEAQLTPLSVVCDTHLTSPSFTRHHMI